MIVCGPGLSWGRRVDEFVARENIRRFRAQLEACRDQQKKSVLRELLEAEQGRLSEIRAHRRATVDIQRKAHTGNP